MAVGSWAGTPFMPNLDIPTSIIVGVMGKDQSKLEKAKGKGRVIELE